MTIGMPFYRIGRNVPEVSIALLPKDHSSAPIADAVVIECNGERGMLETFADILRRLHAILTGYNIDEFDNRYIYIRSQLHGVEDALLDAFCEYDDGGSGRCGGGVRFAHNEKFKMDNITRENLHRPLSTQRATIDTRLRLAKMRPKEFQEAESLNVMLQWYRVIDPETGREMRKMDMPIQAMYDMWERNTPEGNHDIALYCVIDSKATYLLLYWINFFTEMFDLSTASYTTLLDSFHRADGKRVTQLLTRYMRQYSIAFCDEIPPKGYRPLQIPGKIGGGDVKSLAPGLRSCIISLDYKSEYPAQKEGSNVGSSSKVSPDVIAHPERYGLTIIKREEFADQYCSTEHSDWITRARYWCLPDEKREELERELAAASPLSLDQAAAASPLSLDQAAAASPLSLDQAAASSPAASPVGSPLSPAASSPAASSPAASSPAASSPAASPVAASPSAEELAPAVAKGIVFIVEQFWAEATLREKVTERDCSEEEWEWVRKATSSPDYIREKNGVIRWKTFYVQSPRDGKGRIETHYSIQERMLTDLRTERDRVKREMGNCDKAIRAVPASSPDREARISKLKTDKVIFNARQISVKTLMNSEYGSGNNDVYPHFDQDTAATVTWCSRRLAEFLRRVLTCDFFLVPDYIVDRREEVGGRPGDGKAGDGKAGGTGKEWRYPFRELIDRLSRYGFAIEDWTGEVSDDAWRHPNGTTMISTHIMTEKVPVKRWYRLNTPTSMLVYQDTDSNYYKVPVIERVNDDIDDSLVRAKTIMHALLDHNDLYATLVGGLVNRWPIAVSCDGAFLTGYWSPLKKQYMGMKAPISHSGIDEMTTDLLFPRLNDRREGEAVSRFLERKNIKVTGYLIVRRETPDYVVNYLFQLLADLLAFREGNDALKIAKGIVDECVKMIGSVDAESAKRFSKPGKYKPLTKNDVKEIVDRLRDEGKDDLIPPQFSVVRYVLLADPVTSSASYQARGKVVSGGKRKRMRLLSELNGKVDLDVPYYVQKMASALASLVFEEIIDSEMRACTDGRKREELGRLLDDYQTASPADGGKKDKLRKIIQKAMTVLIGHHFTVPGLAREHQKVFRQAGRILNTAVASTLNSRQSLQNALNVAYDRNSTTGELAEKIITREVQLARMRRRQLNFQRAHYANLIARGIRGEEARRRYIAGQTEYLDKTLAQHHHNMVEAYGRLIIEVQRLDPALSRLILDLRHSGEPLSFENVTAAIPPDVRARVGTHIVDLDRKVGLFRAIIVEKDAFRRGLEDVIKAT